MTGGAIEGVRVIDLTSVVVGPVATLTLADHGADVIKIEAPGGDILRKLGGASLSGELSPRFLHLNRNKRSLALNLKSDDGLAVLHRLLATADVCVSNMRPAAMGRLGLGVAELRRINPAIIYCGLVGFGQMGRYAGKPAYDGIIQGMGGVSAMFEEAEGAPRFVPMTLADHVVGLIATQMILLALYRRAATGEASWIEVPMFENMAAFVLSEHMGQLTFDPPRGPPGDLRVLDPGAKPAATKDGYICVSANTDDQVFRMFQAIGLTELCNDPRFSSVQARYANVGAFYTLRDSVLATRTSGEWLALFEKLDVPAGPCHNFEALIRDPHLADVGLFRSRSHPTEGTYFDISAPNRSDGLSRADHAPPPLPGEQSQLILQNLGYTETEIADLIARQVVQVPGVIAGSP